MKRIRLLLLMCVAILVGCQPATVPTVYETYLPIIYGAPEPALKGVGLTGPCSAVENLNADWYYNWHWRRPCGNIPAHQFVPMIRDVTRMEHLPEAIENAQASGWLLGLNEPDMSEPYGHLTTPEEGAEAWRLIEREAVGIKLCSPAPSQEDFDWLWRMVAAYEVRYGEKPRFDAICVHWYNWRNPSSVQPAKDYLLQVRREALAHNYDVPIWLTEFAGHIGIAEPAGGHRKLMEEFIPWMRERQWIDRYAWFASLVKPWESWCPRGCHYCSLTYEGGGLTPIGEFYGGINE